VREGVSWGVGWCLRSSGRYGGTGAELGVVSEVWEGVSLGVVGEKLTTARLTSSRHGVQLREYAMPP